MNLVLKMIFFCLYTLLDSKKTHHRLRSYPWQRACLPVTVQNLKGHKGTIYMAQRFSTLVGLSTHSHLHARAHHVCRRVGSEKMCIHTDLQYKHTCTCLSYRDTLQACFRWVDSDLLYFVQTHLCLKELLTIAFSTSRSPMWDGPRKWNMSMLLKVGWAWHKRLDQNMKKKRRRCL